MPSELLFYNGTVRTMAPHDDSLAQALLVRDGRIAAVGTLQAVKAVATPAAQPIDLAGGALLPGFIDGHSHLSGVASSLMGVALNDIHSHAALARAVREHIAKNNIPAGEWVQATGYDHNLFPEKAHPTTALLDEAAPNNPVLVTHVSGHAGVFNSAALRALELPLDSGYREEGDFIPQTMRLPMPTATAFCRAMAGAQRIYASHGITTVQDGMLTAELLPYYRAMAAEKAFWLDVTGYAGPECYDSWNAAFPATGAYNDHFLLGGVKIFLDGSPQNRTAWMRKPYLSLAGAVGDWYGTPTMTQEQVDAAVRSAMQTGRQILAHTNGDAAAQSFLQALQKAQQAGYDTAALRPVFIHGQLIGHDQLPAIAETGAYLSFFIQHIYRWGDTHIQNFGLERAAGLCPAGTAARLGIPFTFHQDSPVLPPDMLATLATAVRRRTAAGITLGQEDGITAARALRAITRDGAAQYFEEKSKGTLEVGKLADLAVLSADPLQAAAADLADLQVLSTWKVGACVWQAGTD